MTPMDIYFLNCMLCLCVFEQSVKNSISCVYIYNYNCCCFLSRLSLYFTMFVVYNAGNVRWLHPCYLHNYPINFYINSQQQQRKNDKKLVKISDAFDTVDDDVLIIVLSLFRLVLLYFHLTLIKLASNQTEFAIYFVLFICMSHSSNEFVFNFIEFFLCGPFFCICLNTFTFFSQLNSRLGFILIFFFFFLSVVRKNSLRFFHFPSPCSASIYFHGARLFFARISIKTAD